ncbi:MAG: methyltransferase domain-containing protein [Chloroflexota bacterium]|nr:methyltransferase domain-containing protein [Chloroflexota bacterium]
MNEGSTAPVTGVETARLAAEDTSNYRKHTSGNPVQRRLLDRFHAAIESTVAGLHPESFLDAGCGEGFVAEILLTRMPGLAITGFDFNPSSVALAGRKNPAATFVEASIYDIPFDDGSFDVVGCFEVLEHQPDPAAALAELARVARRAVVLSVPHEPFFSLANAARGKNWDIRPRGSDPDHRQLWSRRAFGTFVSGQPNLRVERLDGRFPWTICVAHKV